jgi:outer membrane lipoprotein SlyB
MNRAIPLLAASIPALLLSGCVATTSYSRTLDDADGPGAPPQLLDGTILSIREVVHRTQGDPGGGAVAGSFLGALLGGALTGDAGGAFVGAVGGAAVGAASSQGYDEQRTYVVYVRFDDGSRGRITYYSPPPWRAGDRVRQTARGLQWLSRGSRPAPPPRPAQPSVPPPPPPTELPPPPPPPGPDGD